MGTALTASTIKTTYKDLLHLDNSNAGADATLRPLVDGNGGDTPLHISSAETGVGALGSGDNALRLGSDHATVPFYIASTVATFDGTQDDILSIGWNCRYLNEAPLIAGEHAWFQAFEVNYDSGAENWCEWYLQYVDGSGGNARRPIASSVNRSTHASTNQFLGQQYFYDSAQANVNVSINDTGNLVLNRGTIFNASVGGNSFLTQYNQAGTLVKSVLYLDENDRTRSPSSLYVTPTSAAHVVGHFKATTAQIADIARFDRVGETKASRVNKDGYYMTRQNTAPADDDIDSSEVALWFDDTNGAGKIMFKGKTSNGTIVAGEVALS